MRIEFADDQTALIRTDRAAEMKLPFAVIKAARDKLTFMEAAPDERALRNWKSLHYEKLHGDREGQRSIRVNDRPLGICLIMGLLSACATERPLSTYQVQMPSLQAFPMKTECILDKYADARRCVVILEDDWKAVIQELKAACLALGQPAKECGVDET